MPYTTTTRAELRLLLQRRYESSPFWTDTDANLALNQALRTWNLLTSYWRRRIVVGNGPNDPLVPVSGTLAQQTAVTWQGKNMTGVSVAEIQLLTPNWWQARAGAEGHPSRPLFWAPVGLNLLAIGLLGELQVRHYHEPTRRAPYSVDRVIRAHSEEQSVPE